MSLHAVGVQRGRNWVLRDVSLDLNPGGRWALIGANGAGKTQLLKLLAGDVWPTPTASEGRTYRLGERTVDVIEAKGRIAYLGAETQDKYSRYGWDLTVHDLIATGLHGTDLLLSPVTAAERRAIDACLRTCGLKRLAPRKFSTLSYGQKRLSLLARALCRAPDWLLLDELYNGLDASYRARIDRVLRSVSARGGAWIVASHRACDVPRGTRGLIELEAGRLIAATPLHRTALARLRAAAQESVPRGLGRSRAKPPATRPRAGAPTRLLEQCERVRRLPGGAARAQLGAARRRALGGVRRERLGEDQLPQAVVRRSLARARRPDRAARVSRGHAHRRVEEPGRLRLAGASDRLRGERERPGARGQRTPREHRSRPTRPRPRTCGSPHGGSSIFGLTRGCRPPPARALLRTIAARLDGARPRRRSARAAAGRAAHGISTRGRGPS